MRSWPVALALFASSTASAGLFTASYDRAELYDLADCATLTEQIEVPLYRAYQGSVEPLIEVTLADESVHLFSINMASSGVTVSADFAKAAGAQVREVKFKGLPNKTGKVTVIESFQIGGASFENVPAEIASGTIGAESTSIGGKVGLPVAGSIGIAGFSGMAGALIRSEGLLRLAPAELGESLMGSLEGADQVAYTSEPYQIHTFDKKKKSSTAPVPIVMEAMFGDNDVTMTFGTRTSTVLNDRVIDGLTVHPVGSRRVTTAEFSLAEIVEGPILAHLHTLPAHIETEIDLYIGELAAADWDIAWSPRNSAVALRQATQSGLNDHFEQSAATVLKQIEESQSESDETTNDGEETESAEETSDPNAAKYSTLANISLWSGDVSGALEHLESAENKEDCTYYLQKGAVELLAGNTEQAAAAFQAADALYAPWAALDLETRKKLKKEEDENQPKPQASTCFQAAHLNAMILSSQGDVAKLSELDIGMEEMSHYPALAVGNAYLASGQASEALPAFLQVGRIDRSTSWAGMGIAQLHRSQYDQAIGNLEQALWIAPEDLALAEAYIAAQTAANGAEAAAKAMGELSAQAPTIGAWHLAHAKALIAAGLDASDALTKAEERIQWDLTFQKNGEAMGLFAHAKIARGDLVTGKAIANKALKDFMLSVNGLTALAEISRLESDLNTAKSLLQQAATFGSPAIAAAAGAELKAPEPQTDEEETQEE